MTFPPPPKRNREVRLEDLPKPPPPPPEPPPPIDTSTLTDEETYAILKRYLLPTQIGNVETVKFILSYLTCRNALQASKNVGISSTKGTYLRNRPEIHTAIEAITVKAVMKHGYDASEIIERVKEIATIDPLEFENPDGTFKTHMSQIAPEARRAIRKFKAKNIYSEDPNGMKVVIGQLIEVEYWDKLKGLEMLGREKNIMKETKKIEHDVTANMATVLLESAKRAEERQAHQERNVLEVTGRTYESESVVTSGDAREENRVPGLKDKGD